MKKLDLSEVKDLVAYEKAREKARSELITLKQRRRVAVGDNLTLLFENRATVLFQVQEMMRTERLVHEERIQDELDTYNALLPGKDELSATLFIEIPGIARMTTDQMRQAVNRFQGLERAVSLRIGDRFLLPGRFEAGYSKEEKMAAVQFVRFRVPGEAQQALRTGQPARLAVDHPNYKAEAAITPGLREELLADLAAE